MEIEKKYVLSERVHFMCPDMYFGIMAEIEGVYEKEKFLRCLEALQEAHPFLRSVIGKEPDTGRIFYQYRETLEIPVFDGKDREDWRRDYDAMCRRPWNLMEEGMCRMAVYSSEDSFFVLLAAHHMLCDGRGLLELTEELAECYVRGISPKFAEEQLIGSAEDLPRGSSLPWISRVLVKRLNRQWKKGNHSVSYEEYLSFEKQYYDSTKVCRDVKIVEGEELEKIILWCRKNAVTVKAPGQNRQILAKQVHEAVQESLHNPRKEMLVLSCYCAMEQELMDAIAISALGDFESRAGEFAGKNMFGYAARNGYSITNLGSVDSDVIRQALFLPPMSPATKMMAGVVTVNGRMQICVSQCQEKQN